MVLLSCVEDEEQQPEIEPVGSSAFQELYDQGVDRYLGTIKPISSAQAGPSGVTQYLFSNLDGPVCFTGSQFSMFTRNGSSNNLMIFLQGGGFCSPVVCEAVEEGIPYIPFGILNPSDPQNPVANFNVGYVPYCDGSMMAGDNEVDSDGDGVKDRFFKGLQNLSASLDVIVQNYPSPDKIVLAGNSAGGFAVHTALPLVRKLYPKARIYVVNDSGQGLGNPGGFEGLFTYWNANAFIPSSCSDCIGADGNLTGLHKYQLEQDDNIRMAYISSKQDSISSAALGAPAFEAQLIEAAMELNNAHPERFQSLIDNGDAHTYIIRSFNLEIGGISVRQWIKEMINETADWETVIEL
ncbi:pectinacetylesterase family protein [Aquiflexum gelatinilyticum]|uniref:pectinacetylesterase family protein n=1 Tax=Aquiflexum gelatinilyticum TaxID=2961943 RepID=UPI00216A2404|nr:pectinacetylesterase family protein [Aquiflexum gelatinilyticum]